MRAIKIHQHTIASIIARGISVKIKAILSGSCFALSTLTKASIEERVKYK